METILATSLLLLLLLFLLLLFLPPPTGVFGLWWGLSIGFGLCSLLYVVVLVRVDFEEEARRALEAVTDMVLEHQWEERMEEGEEEHTTTTTTTTTSTSMRGYGATNGVL